MMVDAQMVDGAKVVQMQLAHARIEAALESDLMDARKRFMAAETALDAERAKVKALMEAATDIAACRTDTFKAGNGRRVGLQDEGGEKMWIVPFDQMHALDMAVEHASKPQAQATRRTKGADQCR